MINIAIIGCGYWGNNLIRNFSQIPSCKISYVCDKDLDKLKSIHQKYPDILNCTRDYRVILTDSSVDAVVIALPVSKHYLVAMDSLFAGKHVLVEKPMTANVVEAGVLVTGASKKEKILMVDHTFEYNPAIEKIKEIIESGELGNIYYIRAEWLNLGLLQPDVNVVWDLVPHIISIIRDVANLEVLSVQANAQGYVRKDIPEIASINMKLTDDVSAYLTVSWLEPKKTRKITIVGKDKQLIYDMTNDEEQIKVYDKGVEEVKDIHQFKVNYKYGDIYSPYIKNTESLKNMCEHFIDCIENNKVPRSDGENGLKVVRVLEAIDKSLNNNGCEVKLNG